MTETAVAGMRGPGAAQIDADVLDRGRLAELSEMLGEEKTRGLLIKLSALLSERFSAERLASASRAELSGDAHMAKSSAGLLGFEAFSQICGEIELDCSEGRDLETSLARLDVERRRATQAIAALTRTEPSDDPTARPSAT